MKTRLHAAGAVGAALFIVVFWTATVVAEAFLPLTAVAVVKVAIAYGLIGFVPVMMLTAASGFALARGRAHALLDAKRRRMPFIAANGLLILVPAALFLAHEAQSGRFGMAFQVVQALELAAGLLNLLLIGLNIRDGVRLKARRMERLPR